MNTLWITESGCLDETSARGKTEMFFKQYKDSRYVAYHTGSFFGGWEKDWPEEAFDTLLELRVFNSQAELHLTRSSIGQEFQYRIADDKALENNVAALQTEDPFLRNPDKYRLYSYQLLDINERYPAYRNKEKDSHGCLQLMTTGGGKYSLPIEPEDKVAVVINYLDYDEETGMAKAVDYRMAGFQKTKEGGNEA